MLFDEMNERIPHALGSKVHVLRMDVYPEIQVRMPGRHQKETPIPGGDFVVLVSDEGAGWSNHFFKHDDIFDDVQRKRDTDPDAMELLMNDYADVVFGADPTKMKRERGKWTDSLHPQTFLRAVQALAVAEHRRYAKHEPKGGGRFLPARLASGIVEGLWTSHDAKAVQKRGRPGLDWLISTKGQPIPLQERRSS
jgi:hypothetical protein